MANVSAPNGFQEVGRLDGSSPTEGLTTRLVDPASGAIGYGDPVISLATGFVSVALTASTQIDGIFYGCEYLSTAVGRVVWSNFWPGSGATGPIKAYIKTDPEATFVVQVNGGPMTFADIGANATITMAAPNAITGFSTSSLTAPTTPTAVTAPFRVIGLYSDIAAPGTDGTDNTAAGNRVIVTANNWDRKSLAGV